MAVEVLKSRGVPEDRILFLNLIASPEGVKKFATKFPKLKVVTAFIDEVSTSPTLPYTSHVLILARVSTRRSMMFQPCPDGRPLTFRSYIVPGLGDFGDRFYTM